MDLITLFREASKLATEADKYPVFSVEKKALIRQLGDLFRDNGWPQIAQTWYDAANLRPEDISR